MSFLGFLPTDLVTSNYIRVVLLDFCRGIDAAYVNNRQLVSP